MTGTEHDTDILIIGAGIHGAAIASEACRRGYRVTLLEQYDRPARGTSSRSSKLIHGGLRYLETLQLGLVRECLQDRRYLLETYPDLVHLRNFFIPVYRSSSRSRYLIRLGLSLYALLGGLDASNRFRRLDEKEWLGLEGLNTSGMVDCFQYFDAQTDDELLTARLIDEALRDGLGLHFNAQFVACESADDHVSIEYEKMGHRYRLRTRYLVNAAGPWVNRVLERCRPAVKPLSIDLVQGTHIELPGSLERGIYYLEAPQDRRAVFVMPWQDRILVGTTETFYRGDPAECVPTAEEITYLLGVYNHYFRIARDEFTETDVVSSWAGLRVLPSGEDKPFRRSRETIFHPNRRDNPNIFSIYGGKLTSHHSTALKLLDLLE